MKIAAMLLLAFAFGGLTDRCIEHRHPLKHTWEVTPISITGHSFWFMRPNREIFEAYFDNPPILPLGRAFADVAYTDDNADLRHFVSARLK